ncbi:hypothetical protein JOS77_22925 [Chromobacterium haemolyticum]|nr:hypothetical protein JOS77_22925 [Chromobacterium haemolyticum]
MRYLLRIVELALLVFLIAVTVQNSHAVEFKLFFGQSWSAPLIVFLLLFFSWLAPWWVCSPRSAIICVAEKSCLN